MSVQKRTLFDFRADRDRYSVSGLRSTGGALHLAARLGALSHDRRIF
jgi:hypothetical protein